jgi:hypothetical protein
MYTWPILICCVLRAGTRVEELHEILVCAAQQGWDDIWRETEDGAVEWVCAANDRFINVNWYVKNLYV